MTILAQRCGFAGGLARPVGLKTSWISTTVRAGDNNAADTRRGQEK
jgi:hypothetical protein